MVGSNTTSRARVDSEVPWNSGERTRPPRAASWRPYVVGVAPLLLLAIAGCGANKPALAAIASPAVTVTPASLGSPATTPPTIKTGKTSLGTVLTDSKGHTLYYLSTEQTGNDECTMQPGCSVLWPSLHPPSSGAPSAGGGVGGTVAVITAADGSSEVTFNGWPLHSFSGEPPGHVDGEDEASFGGTWYVATPGLIPTSGEGSATVPGLTTPPALATPPGALPTNPFAPTTPPGITADPGPPSLPLPSTNNPS
jgi:predicted lipoprotein with Yx(FWY)xxD motif